MAWCKQCKRDRRDEDFYPLRKRGWRVTKCVDCVRENMAMWARTSLSKFDPNNVRDVAD